MGASHAKLHINQQPKDSSAPEDGATVLADPNIHQEEEHVNSPNGNCSNLESTPACESEHTQVVKKNNPINWIQKKISFKKSRTPKKVLTTEPIDSLPVEAPVLSDPSSLPSDDLVTTQTPNIIQTIQISTPDRSSQSIEDSEIRVDSSSQIEKVHIQQEIPKIDLIDSATMVESTPILNGVCENHVDEQHPFVQQDSNTVSDELSKSHDLSTEVDVSEKLASLQMGTVELMMSNGHDVATDYDAKEDN